MSLTKITSEQISNTDAFTLQSNLVATGIIAGNSSVNVAINATSVAISGSIGINGQVLTSNGSATYWSSTSASGILAGKAIALAIVFGG